MRTIAADPNVNTKFSFVTGDGIKYAQIVSAMGMDAQVLRVRVKVKVKVKVKVRSGLRSDLRSRSRSSSSSRYGYR